MAWRVHSRFLPFSFQLGQPTPVALLRCAMWDVAHFGWCAGGSAANCECVTPLLTKITMVRNNTIMLYPIGCITYCRINSNNLKGNIYKKLWPENQKTIMQLSYVIKMTLVHMCPIPPPAAQSRHLTRLHGWLTLYKECAASAVLVFHRKDGL